MYDANDNLDLFCGEDMETFGAAETYEPTPADLADMEEGFALLDVRRVLATLPHLAAEIRDMAAAAMTSAAVQADEVPF